MKRVMMLVCLASALVTSTGCQWMSGRRCNNCCGDLGCRPCPIGWQRGGTDYQRCLDCAPGGCGAHAGAGSAHRAGGMLAHGGLGQHDQYANAQPAGAGEASGGPMAQVAYPYSTTRGPRDFLLDNPPTIGQ
jgi:hypothetical protein